MFDEKQRIRELAKETMEYATCDLMNERRRLWSNHNSLNFSRPLIYIRAIPFDEFLDKNELKCTTPYLQRLEKQFLLNRYRMLLDDDYIIEPFISIVADRKMSPNGVYGLSTSMSKRTNGSCAKFEPSIVELDDVKKMCVADYEINWDNTMKNYDYINDILGDIMPVDINTQGILCDMWKNDISTTLTHMRGLEPLMWDMYDNPEWLHELLTFMRDKILMHIDQTQKAHGFKLINHQNQAMPYSNELKNPAVNSPVDSPKELWAHVAAQEFTGVGPDLFKEFMFDYQKPIMEKYGLVAYGCCEDLTKKIDVIRQCKNIRRIAVSPFANAKSCAEQIEQDYVLSWRPNPSSAVSFGIDEDAIRKDLKTNFDYFIQNKNIFDITLKDVETVQGDANAIINWTKIVKDEIMKTFG